MAEVNLLARLPETKRNIQKRKEAQTPENIEAAREYRPTVLRRTA